MSHHWGLRCLKCGDECRSVNRGKDLLQNVVMDVWPAVKPLILAMKEQNGSGERIWRRSVPASDFIKKKRK